MASQEIREIAARLEVLEGVLSNLQDHLKNEREGPLSQVANVIEEDLRTQRLRLEAIANS